MVFMPVTYPMKRPIHCKCERFVDESGEDVRWSLCSWHEDRAQWAARETHLHDPAVCRQCAALPPSAPPTLDVELLARALAIRYYGFRIDAPAPPAQKREAELIVAEYARLQEQDR